MTQGALKVVGLGAGYFARFHYEAWARIPKVQLVGACDTDRDRAAGMQAKPYVNFVAMLKATEPDIVDIVLPPAGHLEAIETALSFTPKAIICQKPFCTSLQEARKATEMAENAGIPLIIHENFRFQPWFRLIKRTIDQRLLGDVLQFTFRLRTGDGQGPKAYMDRQPYFQKMPRLLIHETGVHYIDVFRYLLGEPQAIYADLRRLNPAIKGEDAGYFVFDFDDGKRALFDGNRLLDHAAQDTRLTFGEALLECAFGTLSLTGDGAVTMRKAGTNDPRVILPAQDWQGFAGDSVYALCQHVVSHLNSGSPLENEARDYLVTLALEEAVYASNEKGQKIET